MQDHDPNAPNPAMLFDTLNAYQRTAALRGAIELDLFSAVARGNVTAAALSKACHADARAVRILCDYLVVQGFLTKLGSEYGLSPTAAVFLDRQSPKYMGSIAKFLNSPPLMEAFRDVAELVRRGRTLLEGSGTVEPDYAWWVEFARSMVPLMMVPATFMAQVAAERKPGPVRVLDIAAGHGMFGISIAQQNPQASIVALDWPAVLKVAEENAQKLGVRDRHALLPGDAMQVDYGGNFDLVLLTNFLHHFDEATCVSVMKKVAGALNHDGLVFTLEFVPNEDRVSPPMPATFAFTMLGTTPSGDAYPFSEYVAMWKQAGLGHHELLDIPDSPQRLIISRR